MPIVVDHIKIDEYNPIFYHAAKFVLNGMDDNTDLVFLTGKAGTGKTTFLKYIAERVKNRVILAPTGIAAINAGGQTIHSFFHLNPNILYTPDNPYLRPQRIKQHLALGDERIKAIEKMKLLIIDEVSMLRCELIDTIDIILKTYRHDSRPFGGVPTLLIGDVFQLPPVVKSPDNIIYDYYDTQFFFSSSVYKSARKVFFELDKVYRQDDDQFLGVLNNIRIGKFDQADKDILNKCLSQQIQVDGTICLYPKRIEASELNRIKFDEIRHQVYVFEGIVNNFDVENMANVDQTIRLKVGAQVMTTVNSYAANGDFEYYNGSIGTIIAIDPQKNWIKVRFADNGSEVIVERYTWKNVQQIYDEERDEIIEEEIGSFTQIPVRLAWAITIHKSQGLTLNSVQVNVNGAFAHGQTYVALSRCRSLSGLHLEQQVGLGSIIVDQRVVSFYNLVHTEFMRVFNEVSEVDRLYAEALKYFEEREAAEFIDNICKARRINNYITRTQHVEFIEKVSKHIEKYRLYRELALKTEKAELRCQTLQENLDCANRSLADSKSKINTMGIQVEELEQKNVTLKKDLEVSKSAISLIEKLIQDQKTKISQLEENLNEKDNRIDELKEELDRVNSLPWWKVLLGKR